MDEVKSGHTVWLNTYLITNGFFPLIYYNSSALIQLKFSHLNKCLFKMKQQIKHAWGHLSTLSYK